MAIKLADTARPNNYVDAEHQGTFPVAYAEDVWFADGTRLSEKTFDGQSIQKEELPVASAEELGNIYQYVGETGTYTKGYFYECVSDGKPSPTYSWKAVISAGDSIQKESLPVASEEEVGNIYQYIGETTASFTNGYFYECIENNGSYSWVEKPVTKEEVVEGYYRIRTDAFYEESNYRTLISPKEKVLYIDLNSNQVFRYNGTAYEIVSKCIQTISEPSLLKRNNDVIYRLQNVTEKTTVLHSGSSYADNAQALIDDLGFILDTSTQTETYYHFVVPSNLIASMESTDEKNTVFKSATLKAVYDSAQLILYPTEKDTGSSGWLVRIGINVNHNIKVYFIVNDYYVGDFIYGGAEKLAKDSDVVKVFTGTQAEWDALTTEEKLTYEQVNITDDDAGENFDYYSTTETKTNKVWIDGKPIYRKVLVVNQTISSDTTIPSTIPNDASDYWINYGESHFVASNSSSILPLSFCHPSGLPYQIAAWLSDKDTITLRLGSSQSISKMVAVVEYTKEG